MTAQKLSGWLAVVALILLAVLLVPRIASELSLPWLSNKSQTQRLLPFESNQVTKLLFTPALATTSAELTRQENTWYINSEPADPSAVDRLLNALESAKILSIAAQNESTFEQLGVGTQSAKLLTLTTEQTQLILLIGKAGSTLNTFYARQNDQGEAFLVQGPLWNVLQEPIGAYYASPSARAIPEATAAATSFN